MALLLTALVLFAAILFGIWLERRGKRLVLMLELEIGASDEEVERVADAIVDSFEDFGWRKPRLIVVRGARVTPLAPAAAFPPKGD